MSINSTQTFSNVGWCFSELNVEPSIPVASALECWNQCVAEYSNVTAVDFYPDVDLCFCQDECQCVQETSETVELVVPAAFSLPALCSAGSPGDDDGLDPSLALFAGSWCSSGLDAPPQATVSSAQSCWDACRAEYPNTTAIDFYPVGDPNCFCQDACDCLFESAAAVLVTLATSVPLPGTCDSTPSPTWTPSPTMSPTYELCADRLDWRADGGGDRNCTWVGDDGFDTSKRCAKTKGMNTLAFKACKETCGACRRECVSTRPDSTTWRHRSSTAKDCSWVGDFASVRCGLRGVDGTGAWESCPFACHTCDYSDGSCDDDASWRGRGTTTNVVRDCDWVRKAKNNRCKTPGAPGHPRFAYESCRRSCHSCKHRVDGACADSPDFRRIGDDEEEGSSDKDCIWVSRHAPARCAVKGSTAALGIAWAYDACPVACDTCGPPAR